MVFKWNEDFTSLVLNILQNGECAWNVKFENSRQKTARDNAMLLHSLIKQLQTTLISKRFSCRHFDKTYPVQC